uniref:Uncharacterized protein n=1 Tax=Physcomitrium patens TaxID=3218 RepID=A0A7I4BGD0_PHYPA
MAQSMASPSTVSSATLPLQLSGGEVFSRCGGRGFAAPSPTLKHHGHVVAVANSTASAARGGNWVINQCSQFQQQMGFLASKSTTPINCKRVAGVASISDIFSFVSGGGNKGFGGWGFGGGGGGGGDGSAVPAAGETLFATSDDEALILITEDVIYLQVGVNRSLNPFFLYHCRTCTSFFSFLFCIFVLDRRATVFLPLIV